jgi:PAS domain S-box-containing protein
MSRDPADHDDPGLAPWGEALYRNLVERVPVVVYVDSDEQRPASLYLSPQVEQLLGNPPEAYLADGELWIRQTHADDHATVAERWRAAREHASAFECEYRMIRADGELLWVRDTSVPIRGSDGRVRYWQGVVSDITGVKDLELALRHSEAEYRGLVDNLPAVVYRVARDDDRRTMYVSPHVETALGYSRAEWLDQPDIWMELLHPDDREATLAAHDLHNETGRPWSREYRLIASDGRPVWFRDVAHLVRDDEGRPRYWEGVQLDITELKLVEDQLRAARDDLERRVAARTAALEEANALMGLEIGERKRVEEDLRAAEHRYRVLVEQIPAVTYVWDANPLPGAPLESYTSPRIEQLLGYPVTGWTPDFALSRVHPDDRADVEAAMLHAQTTGEPLSMEYRYLHKDGHIVWVVDQAIVLSRLPDGRPHLFQGVVMDITTRKEAESAERGRLEAEERYRTLVEQIPAITYVELPTDRPDESRLAYVSPQVEQLLGYTTQELLDDPSHFGRLVHPEDRERVFAENAYADATGEPFDSSYRVVARDGRVIWLHSRAVLVRDEEGNPRFWHGLSLDVTAHRELETRYEELAGRVFRDLGLQAE